MISDKLQPFGTSIFGEMTKLAIDHEAINLSQGFPDFEGPSDIIDAAHAAMKAGKNQYARGMGVPPLVKQIAARQKRLYGLDYDPMTEVSVTNGATEGVCVTLLGLLNPGDEVILIEPFYDSYPPCVALAGAVPRYLTLRFPDFAIDEAELAALFNDRTRAIVLNTPHNPTGKVFSPRELALIADLCKKHDAVAITDEVYEHMTYDGAEHIPIATLPGMFERTLRVSSAGKTYSFTGWKVGWVMGDQPLLAAARAAHQFTSFSTACPLQHAIAYAFEKYDEDFFVSLRAEYKERRDLLLGILQEAGFKAAAPQGTYFILVDFSDLSDKDDLSFAKELTTEVGVAAIPPTAFYAAKPDEGRKLLRFAFCKQKPTLEAARERLQKLATRKA